MTASSERLARLRRKLATTDDPEERADLEAAIAALEAASPAPMLTQSITGHAQVGVAVAGSIHGNVYIGGRRADAAEKLLAAYLARLRGRCATIPLEGVRKQKQAGDVLAISLDQVFTQLTVPGYEQREVYTGLALRRIDIDDYITQHTGDEVLPWQRRSFLRRPLTSTELGQRRNGIREMVTADMPFTAEDVRIPDMYDERLDYLDRAAFRKAQRSVNEVRFLGPRLVTDAIVHTPRLVLLGEPGSGKSTVLRYLALTLAEASMDKSVDLTTHLAGWEQLGDHQRMLPIFLPLLPFAQRLAKEHPHRAGADDLWRYIADQLEPGDARTGLGEAVHAELERGNIVLLLDGLDEIAGAESRQQVVGAVAQFGREYAQCRMVVTCRLRAYEGEQNRAWQLAGWDTATLEPWDKAQMHHFIAAWYAAAVQAGGLPEVQCADRVAALQRAIAASADLQRLADRPLLLTIMALVHMSDGRLPEDRVTLYSRCVDILLGQWELRGKEQSDYGALMAFIGLPDRDVQRLRPLLTRAAFKAHEVGNNYSPSVLGRESLRIMTADHLELLDHPDPHRGAQKFLEYTDQRAGLIQATDASDAYAFPHLTFQEYLAGLELTSGVDVVQRIMQHRYNDRWRVPILLGIGDYVSSNKLELPFQLLRELLDAEADDNIQRQRDALFAAEIAADVGWDRLEQGGATFKKLRRDLSQALALVVEGMALSSTERVRAGKLLGELGDDRPGVCTLPPVMVRIEGGSSLIGSTPDEAEQASQYYASYYRKYSGEKMAKRASAWPKSEVNTVKTSIATFCIARYPVTNAQFALFMNDHGYDPQKSWWDEAGRAWLQRDDGAIKALPVWRRRTSKQQPQYWEDERVGNQHSNHPVVGLSWYEVTAFCRWLTQHKDYNPQCSTFRLPSEVEWEFAARGLERRPYPWGAELSTHERLNSDRFFRGTTTVGCFTLGSTPEGVADMAGNVWEWTGSTSRPYSSTPDHPHERANATDELPYVVRGGSWATPPVSVRPAHRNPVPPDTSNYHLGFRLAQDVDIKSD